MKITKEQIRKAQAKARREEHLTDGFKSRNSVHPSNKTYNRKKNKNENL